MSELWEGVRWVLGLEVESLSTGHMAVRALVVYVFGVLCLRVGEKRFLGKNTAFDVLLAIILGSVLSRAVTGNSPFFPTLAAALVLVGLHWLLAALAFRFDWFGTLVKGRERVLVRDGEIQWDEMRASHISRNDLLSALRMRAEVASPDEVKEARLERSGDISVIPRDGGSGDGDESRSARAQPQVIDLGVEDGVKRVRITLG